jgi:Zinc binding domain
MMPDSCCSSPAQPTSPPTTGTCPSCGERGSSVSLLTVQAQVALSLRELGQPPYWFCPTAGCPVVYFAVGAPLITCDQLRERVFQKAPDPDVLVCYCFRYSRGVLQQTDRVGRAAILADVITGTRQGQCACEIRNPQGSCCLGNLRRLLREQTDSFAEYEVDV